MAASSRINKTLRRRIRTFLSVSFGVSMFASLGVSTYAWFSTNKTATTTYRSIVANDSNIVKSVAYYDIASVTTSDGVNTYTFTDLSTTYSIGTYDPMGLNGSNEHQLLIVITLKNAMSNVSLTASADSDILEGGNDWGTVAKDSNGDAWHDTTKFPLSSIVEFHYCSPSIVSGAYMVTGDGEESSFVSISDEKPTYTQNFNVATETTSTDKLYLMLDYNEAAIDSIYSYNIGNEIFSGALGSSTSTSGDSTSSDVEFHCDFTIRVSSNS